MSDLIVRIFTKFGTDGLHMKRYNRREFREYRLSGSRTFLLGLNGLPPAISTLFMGSG